jgi:2-polyprenyl-6-methoxyphenol hydroxylase-like FAD-dependent oxidoreductase
MVEGCVQPASPSGPAGAPAPWDVAIVGGGPAGISTALHLHAAAPRARIVVLEKARYPREKICAGGIGARAFRLLERIGVDVVCPRVALDALAIRLAGDTMVVHQPGLGAVVRRIEFDHALARLRGRRRRRGRRGAPTRRVPARCAARPGRRARHRGGARRPAARHDRLRPCLP